MGCGRRDGVRGLADQVPGFPHVFFCGLEVSHRKTQDIGAVENSVGEKCLTRAVYFRVQALIDAIAATMAETDKRERHGGTEFEVGIRFDELLHYLRQVQSMAQSLDDALSAQRPHDIPEL